MKPQQQREPNPNPELNRLTTGDQVEIYSTFHVLLQLNETGIRIRIRIDSLLQHEMRSLVNGGKVPRSTIGVREEEGIDQLQH